jgi:hypothetical protein
MNLHILCILWIISDLFLHNELTGCCAFSFSVYFFFINFLLIELVISCSLSLVNHANTKTIASRSASIHTNVMTCLLRSFPPNDFLSFFSVDCHWHRCRSNDQYVCVCVTHWWWVVPHADSNDCQLTNRPWNILGSYHVRYPTKMKGKETCSSSY